jgi:putative PIN family toxin of toxin-antitoxin system
VERPSIVLDTNVPVSGFRSRRGASFRLLRLVGTKRFEIVVSVPLVLEYEEKLLEHSHNTGLSAENVGDVLDYLCSVGRKQPIFFLWRPWLRDPEDDHVLEVAVASSCNFVVTFNQNDLAPAKEFGIAVVTPKEFLKAIGELP